MTSTRPRASPTAGVRDVVARLRGTLVPAVPIPWTDRGQIDLEAQRGYARWMASQPVSGVAVWAHTGRGLHLSREHRLAVLAAWRDALPRSAVLVAGCGVPGATPLPAEPNARTDAVIAATLAIGRDAKSGGATALMVHPPAALAQLPDVRERVVAVHEALAELDLPLIAFLLYHRASRLEYDDDTVDALLSLPHVAGIKLATLDGLLRVQELSALVRTAHSDRLLITGEDRFLGYSLLLGAQCALIGMGSACVEAQAALVRSAIAGDNDTTVRLLRACDEFARVTFGDPVEGYIQRMLWALAAEGVIPATSCHDPFGPLLAPAERERVEIAVRRLRTEA